MRPICKGLHGERGPLGKGTRRAEVKIKSWKVMTKKVIRKNEENIRDLSKLKSPLRKRNRAGGLVADAR